MNGTNSTGYATGQARVGWVSPPNAGRSTWGIIWSCLAVFLLCSWKCTHLNIPTVEESEAGWHKIWCIPVFPEKPLLRKWGRKLFFMALIAIGPEVVVALAMRQYMQARRSLQSVNAFYDNGGKYTLAHAMFAQMGGYVVHYYGDSTTQDAEAVPNSQKRDTEAGAEGPDANQAMDTGPEASIRNAMRVGDGKPSRAQFLELSGVAKLEGYGILFNLEEEDIKDRSKADPFTKVFALVQASWLVLQSCARKSAGLQITELELMTMAFTVCALVTYILWWHKPFDVERSAIVSLPVSYYRAIWEVQGQFWGQDKNFTDFRKAQHNIDLNWDSFTDMFEGLLTRPDLPNSEFVCSLTVYVFGAIFSAIHFAAWNWSFSTPIVQTLWQSFCCAAFASAILPLLLVLLGVTLPDNKPTNFIIQKSFLGILGINIISRLALIGLTFYCFTSMPASTYQDLDWTLFLPHFS